MTDILERSPHLRGLGFYNPDEQQYDKVTFVGVGGIGSFAAFGAAKLGVPNITVIDPDTVEEHNYGNQVYLSSNVGQPKAEAITDLMAPDHIHDYHICRADADTRFDGVVVSGLDSMEARAQVWEAVKFKPQIPLYLDARIGGQIIVIYAVRPLNMEDIEAYERTLHSDDEGVEAPCTERGVIDVGLMVGAVLTNLLRRYLTGKGDGLDPITYINMETLTITEGEWL